MSKQYKARLSGNQTTARIVFDEAEVSIKATLAEGDKPAGPPTFSGVAYSGGIVPRHTIKGGKLDADYIIDLSGMTQGRAMKANLDHDRKQRVGHVAKFENDKKQISVEGVLSAATPHRDLIANSDPSYGWNVSIEADLAQPEKLKRGEATTVNGRKVDGPLVIFRKSKMTDIAFVDRGADMGNAITIAASDEPRKTTLRELRAAANSN
jgi:hypothetical protein